LNVIEELWTIAFSKHHCSQWIPFVPDIVHTIN
jgi:hypothetical protein